MKKNKCFEITYKRKFFTKVDEQWKMDHEEGKAIVIATNCSRAIEILCENTVLDPANVTYCCLLEDCRYIGDETLLLDIND